MDMASFFMYKQIWNLIYVIKKINRWLPTDMAKLSSF